MKRFIVNKSDRVQLIEACRCGRVFTFDNVTITRNEGLSLFEVSHKCPTCKRTTKFQLKVTV